MQELLETSAIRKEFFFLFKLGNLVHKEPNRTIKHQD